MPEPFDLNAYFRRIGFTGTARPDLETLTALHSAHVAAIPFESLDPLLGRPVRLDLDWLQAKLVGSRRGGYCFEQNSVFRAALQAIGFTVTALGARVVWMSQPGAPLGPRGHMLLLVELAEGPFLADVGFGAHLLDAPLRLEIGPEQSTPAATYRLDRDGDLIVLSARQDDSWRRAYLFDLHPPLASDYAMANWFCSTSPDVPFTHTLIIERLTPEARFNLVNTRLTERRKDGQVSVTNLSSAAEFGDMLDGVFGIEAPAPIDEVFQRISTG